MSQSLLKLHSGLAFYQQQTINQGEEPISRPALSAINTFAIILKNFFDILLMFVISREVSHFILF